MNFEKKHNFFTFSKTKNKVENNTTIYLKIERDNTSCVYRWLIKIKIITYFHITEKQNENCKFKNLENAYVKTEKKTLNLLIEITKYIFTELIQR